jgi:hypothetical protein
MIDVKDIDDPSLLDYMEKNTIAPSKKYKYW